MFHCHREELRRELLRKGYSKRYVRRLLLELDDHWDCLIDERDVVVGSEKSPMSSMDSGIVPEGQNHLARLGTSEILLRTVEGFPELQPWARRQPVTVFCIVPAILMGMLVVVMVGLGLALSTPSVSGRAVRLVMGNSSLLAGGQLALLYVTPFLICCVSVWLRSRANCPWSYPFLSSVIAAMGGFVSIHFGICENLDSVFFRCQYGLNAFRLSMPLLLVGLLMAMTKAVDARRTTPIELPFSIDYPCNRK